MNDQEQTILNQLEQNMNLFQKIKHRIKWHFCWCGCGDSMATWRWKQMRFICDTCYFCKYILNKEGNP